MPWADRARRVKHAGFLARKRAYRGYIQARDLSFAAYNTIVPYQFDPEQHKDAWGDFPRMYFLDRDPPPGVSGDRSVPRQIFTLWTGDNEMSPNRIAGLTSLQSRNPDIPIIHVTPDNLSEYVVDEHPIHPAYQHLSLVHRSDYLRAYFMHHHGGGYSDIKSTSHSWTAAFDRITREKILWIIGYQVPSSSACGGRDPRLGHEIRRRYRALVGDGAYICRPGTPLTGERMREIERRLDYYGGALADAPGNTFGDNPGYPIKWIELGMDILHPLQLKYLTHVGHDDRLRPSFTDHR